MSTITLRGCKCSKKSNHKAPILACDVYMQCSICIIDGRLTGLFVCLCCSLPTCHGRHYDLVNRYICVTNNHGYILCVVIRIRPFHHSLHITEFATRVTRLVHSWSRNYLPFWATLVHPRFQFLLLIFYVLCRIVLFIACPLSFCHDSVCHSIYGF